MKEKDYNGVAVLGDEFVIIPPPDRKTVHDGAPTQIVLERNGHPSYNVRLQTLNMKVIWGKQTDRS